MPSTNPTNGNGNTRKRDYAELLDDASLKLDGLDARIARSERELRRLLGGHQNAEAIMQLISRPGDGYAVNVGKRAVLARQVDVYRAGLEREQRENGQTVSEIPVSPEPNGHPVAV
jgi:hypothetical protein